MAQWMITGAGRGIGLAITQQLLAEGERVIGSVRRPREAEALQLQLGAGFKPVIFDVTDGPAIAAAAAAIDVPIDVLINNAGVIGPDNDQQSTAQTDFDAFAETLNINTLGPLRVSQAFRPHLARGTHPRLAVISSQMGGMDSSASDRIAYRASKAGVNKIVQAIATDWTEMAVVALHPGWVQTDMGGNHAAITPEASAAGIIALMRGLRAQDSGQFFDWDGTKRVW